MSIPQPGILAEVPAHARYQIFRLRPEECPKAALLQSRKLLTDGNSVGGFGPSLVLAPRRRSRRAPAYRTPAFGQRRAPRRSRIVPRQANRPGGLRPTGFPSAPFQALVRQIGAGLVFVGFGCTLDAFDQQMRRISYAENGVVDALLRFTRPVSGASFWCPPMREGILDVQALGL